MIDLQATLPTAARASGVSAEGDPPSVFDLATCESEPIHIPGAIQPHGLLLVVDPLTLTVVAGAGDIEARLCPDWLGRSVSDLLGSSVAPDAVAAADLRIALLDPVAGVSETFDATAHVSGGWLLIELEPASSGVRQAARLLSTVDVLSLRLDNATDFPALCAAAATAFRALTGFDRVMIYRFLDDDAGLVLADARAEGVGSFLNHHFPASDIPRQARTLYVRNRIRVIPDVAYRPAPIRPSGIFTALDMSDIALRSVSPIHVNYLKNMGVAASASVSIVIDGILWGLIACHHRTPLTLCVETRIACNTLAGVLARQIKAGADDESYRQRIRLRSQEDAIVARLGIVTSLRTFFGDSGDDLCRMLGATGFAAVQGRQVFSAGDCPSDAQLRKLAAWLRTRASGQPFRTETLARDYAKADAYRGMASGCLATVMSTDDPIVLMWFRAEQLEIVNWAGNPHKVVADGEAASAPLSPRASFEAWSETVFGRSTAWTLMEIEAADRLGRTMFDIRQAKRLRSLNQDLATKIADNESLLAQKDYLIKEVNHRIQNSLTLVASFLAIQSRATGDEALTAHLSEAQRRLTAVALVHRRLYSGDQIQMVDLARYLEDLCSDIASSMGVEWSEQISLNVAPVLVPTDRAVNVGLILTELLINANKYAYGGAPGPIAISLDQNRTGFRLIVADRGKGKTGSREGFGTRMLNAMVKSLSGTIEERTEDDGLRVIVNAPIQVRAGDEITILN
jgi:chemotaxis family two-component system sensor kinase Cph1